MGFNIFKSTEAKKGLEVGDKVPYFELLDQNGVLFTSDNVIGKQGVVIYFYPKDDTPGCTKQACKFRDEFEVFSNLNVSVIGISKDSVASHKEFEEKYRLPFTLLADTENEVRKLFGVSKSALGMIPGRVTYIVDKEGVIQYIFDDMMHSEKHIDVALEFLRG
ncbi:MAG: peroxiredoxin [Flavobacteriaceae bacterium]|nr:MAG: peroxiredoxin [Flavobacteriaceae bacterium]